MLQIHSLEELYSYLTRHKYKAYKNYYSFEMVIKELCTISDLVFKFNKVETWIKLDDPALACYRDGSANFEVAQNIKHLEELALNAKKDKLWFHVDPFTVDNCNNDNFRIIFALLDYLMKYNNSKYIAVMPTLLENQNLHRVKQINCNKPFENAFVILPLINQLKLNWLNIRIYDSYDSNFTNEVLGGWLPVEQKCLHALGQLYGDSDNSLLSDADDTDHIVQSRSFVITWCCLDANGDCLTDWIFLDKLRDDNVAEFRKRIATRHIKYKDTGIDYTRLDEINNFVINFIGYLTEPSQIVYAPQPETIEPTRKMKASEKLNLKSYTFLDVKPEVIIKKEPIGTHKSPEPHLRRGHYRRQRYGKGLEQEKLIFIPELRVNEPK